MNNSVIRQLVLFCLFLFFGSICFSQNATALQLDATSEVHTDKPNLLDVLVSVNNSTNEAFEGKLLIDVPLGMRSISGAMVEVSLNANEKQYIPLKIWIQKEAEAGVNTVQLTLIDKEGHSITQQKLERQIEENNQLKIYTDQLLIYLTNPDDSLRIKMHVSNLGNREQNVALLVKIPELIGENNFFELKGKVKVQQDTAFVFTFLPNRRLLNLQQFHVQISGMRGGEKELFANLNIVIQNVASTQQFVHTENNIWSNYSKKNTFTASYRRIGSDTGIAQIQGAADIDLPAGYLSIGGIAYKSSNEQQMVLNNASLTYRLNTHQLTLGNLSKPFEMSLMGRGISVFSSDVKQDKSIEIGFIDQQFNLIENQAFLKNGYGFYARGVAGASNYSKNLSGTYIFRHDPYEAVQHQMLSGEFTYDFTSKWRVNTKIHTALSHYENLNIDKSSYALETQYNGTVGSYRLFGNYFLSTAYFPGNRRGITQIQQNIHREIGATGLLTAAYFYSDFSPKSPIYSILIQSENTKVETGFRWKLSNTFGMGILYQFQNETSSSYNSMLGLNSDFQPKLYAHRLSEQVNWTSSNQMHQVHIELENGWASYPFRLRPSFQGKAQVNYSFKAFNSNISYQKGSYYLSEYLSYYRLFPERIFFRFMASAAFQKQFLSGRLNINSGISYLKDALAGNTPSFFLNTVYTPNETLQFYTNASWFKYDTDRNVAYTSASRLLTLEAGIRFNIDRRTPSAGKKSRVQAHVYYDHNANNYFDEGDEPAPHYMTILNNTSFLTDDQGDLTYKSVPFGSYAIQPLIQNGWYPALNFYTVNDYRTFINIPLHRNGVVKGGITYEYDEKRVINFEPKMAGIICTVMQQGKPVQKIVTDNEGQFTAFLPTGTYQMVLSEHSLPMSTYCEQPITDLHVESGKMVKLIPFIIRVTEKTIQVKKFGS